MIKIEELEQLENLKKEQKSIQERIKKIERKNSEVVVDSVKGSSARFPYTKCTIKIEGNEESIIYKKRKNMLKKLKRMLLQKENEIIQKIKEIEYELNYIEDSEIREIIRLRYEENLSWIQIMFRRGYKSEDVARKKIKRFLKI